VHIILRADSGFCRDELMDWAEQQEGVDYVFGRIFPVLSGSILALIC
jgi:hypothetical protein